MPRRFVASPSMAPACTSASHSMRCRTSLPAATPNTGNDVVHVASRVRSAHMNTAMAHAGSSIDQTEIRFLVEKNADGIIVVDDDGIVLFANPAAEHIFGRPSERLMGFPIGIPLIAGDTTEIAIHRPGDDCIDAEI